MIYIGCGIRYVLVTVLHTFMERVLLGLLFVVSLGPWGSWALQIRGPIYKILYDNLTIILQ